MGVNETIGSTRACLPSWGHHFHTFSHNPDSLWGLNYFVGWNIREGSPLFYNHGLMITKRVEIKGETKLSYWSRKSPRGRAFSCKWGCVVTGVGREWQAVRTALLLTAWIPPVYTLLPVRVRVRDGYAHFNFVSII